MADDHRPCPRLERALRKLEESLGALNRRGRAQDAIQSLREAIALKPGDSNLRAAEVLRLEALAYVTTQHITQLRDRILKGEL